MDTEKWYLEAPWYVRLITLEHLKRMFHILTQIPNTIFAVRLTKSHTKTITRKKCYSFERRSLDDCNTFWGNNVEVWCVLYQKLQIVQDKVKMVNYWKVNIINNSFNFRFQKSIFTIRYIRKVEYITVKVPKKQQMLFKRWLCASNFIFNETIYLLTAHMHSLFVIIMPNYIHTSFHILCKFWSAQAD